MDSGAALDVDSDAVLDAAPDAALDADSDAALDAALGAALGADSDAALGAAPGAALDADSGAAPDAVLGATAVVRDAVPGRFEADLPVVVDVPAGFGLVEILALLQVAYKPSLALPLESTTKNAKVFDVA